MSRAIIYHAQCIDGFTAAWVAQKRFGDSAEFIPAAYGTDPPDVTGRDVWIVDFSYPRSILLGMRERASSLYVLDHHKTAKADLDGLEFCQFDMDRSGAGMAWDCFFPEQRRPPLVDYVEDRDIWRWALPNSKEINALIGGEAQSFQNWDVLDRWLRDDMGSALGTGARLLRQVERYVEEMATQARMVEFGGYLVPVVNAPYINTSELVGKLSEGAMFAVGWYQRGDGKYQYSLRSRGDFDVSALAKLFGGGGHKGAAGFVSESRVHQ